MEITTSQLFEMIGRLQAQLEMARLESAQLRAALEAATTEQADAE